MRKGERTEDAPGFPDESGEEVVLSRDDSRILGPDQSVSGQMLRQTLERLEALTSLAGQICRPIPMRHILDTALRFVNDLLRPERAVFCVLDASSASRYVVEFGFDTTEPVECWPISKHVLRRVREGKEAILSSDACVDERFRQFESVSAEHVRSMMCAPLFPGEETDGFVYLDSRMQTNCFTENDLRFLIAIARYVDLAAQYASRLEHEHNQTEIAEERLRLLQKELFEKHRVVGQSKALLQAYKTLKELAPSSLPILLTGETGTGKELFARAVHTNSPRANGPYVPVNLAALSPNLVEAELFGYEKNAFTGADATKPGLLELADGGTLFLDELGETPHEVQVKLLRAIETKSFQRVGGTKTIHSDFRLSASASLCAQMM